MRRGAKKNIERVEVRRAYAVFGEVLETVEDAKESLVAAAPGRRGAGVQLAEALWAFEAGIDEARQHMPGWRTADTEAVWQSCVAALEECTRSAEELRLGAPPEGYEELYARLGALIELLEPFAHAGQRFRDLGS